MDDPRPPATPSPFGPGNPPPFSAADSRSSIDELADLYLTGVHAPSAAAAQRDPLEGPAPIRLAPKPAMQGGAGSAVLDAQPMLAEQTRAKSAKDSDNAQSHPILRLTEGDDDDTPAQPRRAGADARAVVLGNLPGLSGPWLTQYAQVLAQSRGPVAVLHVDEETIDLELVEVDGRNAIVLAEERGEIALAHHSQFREHVRQPLATRALRVLSQLRLMRFSRTSSSPSRSDMRCQPPFPRWACAIWSGSARFGA